MAFSKTAWAVGGGADVTTDDARRVASAATSGSDGIITPAACKVTQTPTASLSVHIAKGAVAIVNRFASSLTDQSYVGYNDGATGNGVLTFPQLPTAKRYLVIVRINDHQFAGAAPADPVTATYCYPTYIEVAAGIRRTEQLNLGYPAVALAAINYRANATSIIATDIEDVRELASPRTAVFRSSNNLPNGRVLTETAYYDWPTGNVVARVPSWANWADMIIHLGSIGVGAGGVDATLRCQIGSLISGEYIVDEDPTTNGTRRNYFLTCSGWMGAQMGQEVTLKVQGKKHTAFVDNTTTMGTNLGSQIAYDCVFTEKPI